MKTSITLYRAQCRRLERQVQKSRDALHMRCILAVLYLADGQSVSAVARRLAAARWRKGSALGRDRTCVTICSRSGYMPVSSVISP